MSSFLLFEDAYPSANTLTMTMWSCSKGKLNIDFAKAKVYTFKIKPANCVGATWAWNQCGTGSWALTDSMRIFAGPAANWSFYTSHWFPASMNCSFGGVGAISADYIWIPNQRGRANSVRVWAHELGHNPGMHLASARGTDGVLYEYDDRTGIMGSASSCFNIANRETADWETPARTIESKSLALGKWIKFAINPNIDQLLKSPCHFDNPMIKKIKHLNSVSVDHIELYF